MRTRLSLAATGLLLTCLIAAPTPANAAAALKIDDPVGDALDPRPPMDIVSVTIESKPFQPRNTPSLVVTLELAGPLDQTTATAVSYNLNTEIVDCGYLQFTYSPGTLLEGGPGSGAAYSNISTSCGGPPDSTGDGTYLGLDAKAAIDGNKLILWTSWASLTKEIRAASKIGAIRATTEIAEPATGIIGAGIFGPGAADEAVTDKIWTYSVG